MARSLHDASRTKRDNVSTETYSRTIHVVHVNIAHLLANFDITDEVQVMLETPSGRAKRVQIGGNFLAPSRHIESEIY